MSQLYVDNIKNRTGGAIGAPAGIVVSGVGTFSGNVSIGGTLSYEDVTNIDSVGIITARSDISIADKIVHTGDTNTAIRFPAADTFTVETAGSEALRVTSAGYLGINDTGASRALAIKYNDNTAHSETAFGPAGGAIRIFNQSTTTNATAGEIIFGAGDSGTGYATINAIRVGSQECELSFRVSDSATLNEALRLDKSANATFSGTVSDSIGPLRRLGVNAQSGAYTFVVGDAGKIIRSAGSGAALTLNQNIFTAGDMISVFNVSNGNNTIVQGTGVALYNTADGTTGTRTIAAKGMATLVCTNSNEFAISGSQLT